MADYSQLAKVHAWTKGLETDARTQAACMTFEKWLWLRGLTGGFDVEYRVVGTVKTMELLDHVAGKVRTMLTDNERWSHKRQLEYSRRAFRPPIKFDDSPFRCLERQEIPREVEPDLHGARERLAARRELQARARAGGRRVGDGVANGLHYRYEYTQKERE